MGNTSQFFDGVNPEVEDALLESLPRESWSDGQTLLQAGQENDQVLLISSGLVEVRSAGVRLTTLGPGECVGEMSALAGNLTTADVVAVGAVEAWRIDLGALPSANGVKQHAVMNVARRLTSRLSETNERLVQTHEAERATQRQLLASLMMVGRILVSVSCYVFMLPIAAWLKPVLPSDSIISFGFIALLTATTWGFQRKSGFPRAVFYLQTKNALRQLRQGALLSLPWLGAILVLKAVWITLSPETDRLFEPERAISLDRSMNWGVWASMLLIYVALGFAQEYVRAVTQGGLAFFYRTAATTDHWKSILIANIVFAILHVHLSPVFAILAFASGLLWGWIMQREHSYLAASASHVLVGLWAVFVIGIPY